MGSTSNLSIGPSVDPSTPESDVLIKAGNIVTCYLVKYQDEEPQIAKIPRSLRCLMLNETQLKYSGYKVLITIQCPCKTKKGSMYEPWVE